MAKTNKHYDIDHRFFSQFLDPYMKYTSGLHYSERESLEEGALNMLNIHLKFLDNYAAPRVLEIGSGWGSFLKRLSEEDRQYTYSSVNPSKVQNDFIKSHLLIDANIFEAIFEDIEFKPNSFDIIYFIGSLCHLKNKAAQFKKLRSILSKNGRIIVEDTFFISEYLHRKHVKHDETIFVQKEIFGFAEILSLPKFLEMSSSFGMQIQTLLEHSKSYSKTIELWIEKLSLIKDHPKTKEFIRYLEIAQQGWQYTIANYLIELKKVR